MNAANAPFRPKATAPRDQSTYAGIIAWYEAQQSKALLVRLADKYAFLFLPLNLAEPAVAWLISGDPVRGLAVLVVGTPARRY